MNSVPTTWADVLRSPELKTPEWSVPELAVAFEDRYGDPLSTLPGLQTHPVVPVAWFDRVLRLCPCLYSQLDARPSARAIVHFCELTLRERITSANVYRAFQAQHPVTGQLNPRPITSITNGGSVMEMLCSEVLTNEGIPVMKLGLDRWPEWEIPGHILLNEGEMRSQKALGDILIPCAPTNIVISVKSEAARERLLYSANSIEGIGFGFFRDAKEFWTSSRMSLYKRMGFTAIYMPDETHRSVMERVHSREDDRHAININGTELYRPLTSFGADMRRITGRSSNLL